MQNNYKNYLKGVQDNLNWFRIILNGKPYGTLTILKFLWSFKPAEKYITKRLLKAVSFPEMPLKLRVAAS